MGGACDGGAWVSRFWENNMWSACRDCLFHEEREDGERACQVVEGREEARECPELAEYIAFEGVQLYGENKPPPRKQGWRR